GGSLNPSPTRSHSRANTSKLRLERVNMRQKSTSRRNLLRRPARLGAGNGRLQVQCSGTISSGDAYDWGYPRHDRRDRRWYGSIRRAVASIGAVRTGRAGTRGRPWLWRLRIPVDFFRPRDANV